MLNYYIGYRFGRGIIQSGKVPFFKPKNLEEAESFYNKYGASAVILSRFFPIVRSFVPFVAGIGRMNWMKYMLYNVIGGVSWIVSLTLAGYFFGEMPFIKDNLTYFIILLLLLPFMPAVLSWIQRRRARKAPDAE